MNYSTYVTHRITLENNSRTAIDTIVRPKISKGENSTKYNSIDQFGYPIIGSRVKEGDCILGVVRSKGKLIDIDSTGNYTVPEGVQVDNISMFMGVGDEGYIECVRLTRNAERNIVVKIKIAKYKMASVGDKFASSQIAQKGVCGYQMPASENITVATGPNEGMQPEIIFNGLGFITRMTMNMIVCMVILRWAIFFGKRGNTTTFSDHETLIKTAIKDLTDYAKSTGMDEDSAINWAMGNEICRSADGEIFESHIFIGPVTMQLLRHLVDGKIQCRGQGPIQKLNRQPPQGKSKGGGLKFGDMENNAIVGHGAPATTKELTMEVSDLFTAEMCKTCGNFAILNPHEQTIKCQKCGPEAIFVKVPMPYNTKLIVQMMRGMGIDTEFQLTPKK